MKYLILFSLLLVLMFAWHNTTLKERRHLWVACRPYLFYAIVSLLSVGVVIQLATSGQSIRVL